MKVETLAEQFARREELRELRAELKYAQEMSRADWRYGTIARCLEAELTRKTFELRRPV